MIGEMATQCSEMQTVLEAWATQLGNSKYTESLVADIETVQIEVTMCLSLLGERTQSEDLNESQFEEEQMLDPEVTFVSSTVAKTRFQDVSQKFRDLKDIVQQLLQPQPRRVKRSASDAVDPVAVASTQAAVADEDPDDFGDDHHDGDDDDDADHDASHSSKKTRTDLD